MEPGMADSLARSLTYRELAGRAVASGNFGSLQIWFDAHVLDRYRADPDSRILRSDSAGRVRGPGGWMVNFGIAPDNSLIHLEARFLAALPEREQPHWLDHLVIPPAGENFLKMVLSPAACIDDGLSRDW
jgi:hypothetical protein